jgi:hypothetical protein
MLQLILFLILPTFLAGVSFILFLKWNKKRFLNQPLDFHIKINGQRLFGENKTIQGPVCMSLFTMIFGFIVYEIMKSSLPFHLAFNQILIFYFLIGAAYSLGELPNSFLKRMLSIPPGKSYPKGILTIVFKILDTFDSLLAIAICYILFFKIDIKTVLITLLIGGLIHLFTDQLMRSLGLKKLH